jgi:hypothetical protein
VGTAGWCSRSNGSNSPNPNSPSAWPQEYYVYLENGRVTFYGRKGDFGSATNPSTRRTLHLLTAELLPLYRAAMGPGFDLGWIFWDLTNRWPMVGSLLVVSMMLGISVKIQRAAKSRASGVSRLTHILRQFTISILLLAALLLTSWGPPANGRKTIPPAQTFAGCTPQDRLAVMRPITTAWGRSLRGRGDAVRRVW